MANSKLSKMGSREKYGAISAQDTEYPLKNCLRIFLRLQNAKINFRGWQKEHNYPITRYAPQFEVIIS